MFKTRPRYYYDLKTIVITIIFFSITLSSFGGEKKSCVSLISHLLNDNGPIKTYVREVKKTKGVRIFLKDFDSSEEVPSKWAGLLTYNENTNDGILDYINYVLESPSRVIGRVLSKGPYLFTPFNIIYTNMLSRPTRMISKKILNREMEPTTLVNFGFFGGAGIASYILVDSIYQKEFIRHIEEEIGAHGEDYDALIETDYRYIKIKRLLKSKKITKEEARREAYLVKTAYSQFFTYLQGREDFKDKEFNKKLLDHYLFTHLKNIFEKGIEKADGFIVPKSSIGEISEDQKLSLFKRTYKLYLSYQIVQEFINETALFSKMKDSSEFRDMIGLIEEDPFTTELVKLHNENIIDRNELISYLQEDQYWQHKFDQWKTIKVQRLKKGKDGFLDSPLSLKDIRNEILEDISSQHLSNNK